MGNIDSRPAKETRRNDHLKSKKELREAYGPYAHTHPELESSEEEIPPLAVARGENDSIIAKGFSIPIFNVPDEIVAQVFTFLSFRELCYLRAASPAVNEIVMSESFWSLLCVSHGIEGTLVEVEDETSAEAKKAIADEPHPLKMFRGAGAPVSSANQLVSWQLVAYFLRADCPHVTPEVREAFLKTASEELRLNRHNISTACSNCGKSSAKFLCSGCCKPHGSRSMGCGCMATHECTATSKFGIRMDYADVYCYQCDGSVASGMRSIHSRKSDNGTPLSQIEALKHAASRDPRVAVHHFGLYQRNQCPHIDEDFIARLKKWWTWRTAERICNGKCANGEGLPRGPQYKMPPGSRGKAPVDCSKMDVFLCLACKRLYCGAGKDGHAYHHAQACGHFVFVALRTLNIWCFSCDRYLGFGGSAQDTAVAKSLRQVLRSPKLLSQHSTFPELVDDNVIP